MTQPRNPRQASLRVEPDVVNVSVARHFVCSCLRAWGLSAAQDNAGLAVSELVANAVKHAAPASPISVRLTVEGDILVTVLDGAADATPTPRFGRVEEAESGRGLHIVATVATEWGTRVDEGGKAVWFRLGLPEQDRPPLRSARRVDGTLVAAP
ncbi:MAG: ATP-binding protein [Sporichthyaceae bacterium]